MALTIAAMNAIPQSITELHQPQTLVIINSSIPGETVSRWCCITAMNAIPPTIITPTICK